jgi:hypothetical protein
VKHSLPTVTLCVFSKAAEGIHYTYVEELARPFPECIAEKVEACPLDLPASRARVCACKRNVRLGENFEGATIRGASCTHPLLSNGEEIRNEALLRAWILKR